MVDWPYFVFKDSRMKKIVFVVVFCSLMIGCRESSKKITKSDMNRVCNNAFPQVMVGVWETQEGRVRWGIKFEPDGVIKKVYHMLAGQIYLDEKGKTLSGPDPNTYAAFVMGPCTAKYNNVTKALDVVLILDFYEMKLPNGVLRGKSEDRFSGHISADGTTWDVEWRSYGWLEDAAPPDINEINANPEKLTFYKIDPTKLNDKNYKTHIKKDSNEVRIHFGPY